ncbi:MAG: hypothetical protein JJ971_11520 [Balneolaceae bacterium]|nr:hypothetical protein [Balneolaceae bacterium]MBO6547522.1 hypothetical protein [Balneolaceae bacterium]MBO6647531.1 hypothetical protein [Balneolaceae bacterium]
MVFALLEEGEVYHTLLEYDVPPVYVTRINHAVYKESVTKITLKDD